MKANKILLVSHVYHTESGPVYGPFNVIKDFLKDKNVNFDTIEYPLNQGTSIIIKSVSETVHTMLKAFNYRPDIFIGIDPLNAFAGVLLKKGGRIKKTIFYCVDYTPARFKNKFLNFIYLGVDKFVSEHSDEVWNVSTRIVDIRKGQGISESKIKYIPNSPPFNSCPRSPVNKIDRKRIVMVAGLTHSSVFDIVLDAFKNSSKKIPGLHLLIIGTGPYQEKLIQKVKKMNMSKNIIFTGQLSNEKLMKEVSVSGMALAIYTFSKKYSWVYYGDSKKAREYLACGVPVIITDVVSTSQDIGKFKTGLVIKPNVKDVEYAINKLGTDKAFWLECRKNALELAKRYDIDQILDKNFKSIL